MRRSITTILFVINILSAFCQTEKPYLPTQARNIYLPSSEELAFPKEVAQRCFGIKQQGGSITTIEQAYGHINVNKSYINQAICIGDKTYERGIGVHAASCMFVHLPRPASRFQAEIGLDNNPQTKGRALFKIIFSIETEKKVLWQSQPIAVGEQAVQVDIPLNGISDFYLKVRSAGERVNLCHADWANARVVYVQNETVYLDEYFSKTSTLEKLPFSFVLGGKSSRDFLNTWKFSFTDSIATEKTVHRLKWVNPENTFELHCLLTEYTKHPVLEWKLSFKNTGTKNSTVLEKVESLDATVSEPIRLYPNQSAYSPAFVHCNKGSNNSRYDFMPIDFQLDLEQNFPIKSHNGRSSETYLPFWNLEYHNCGLVTALGWSGDWQANFSYPKSNNVLMQAGMTNICLYLKPGEEISTPSVCLLYWEGANPLRGNNLFRRYMRDQVAPKLQGKEPIVLAMSGGSSALETVNEQNQTDYIRKIAGSGVEVYWLDAGWYAGNEGDSWDRCRGNWYPDPKKFPNGMKILADEAHKNGLKFLLWFDPESVSPGSDISKNHPEWVIRRNEKEVGLFNLGNQQALKYMTDLISKNLIDWNVDIYRNDYNIDPGPMWKYADELGRTGISEIRYTEGLYSFWDQLIKRKPGLLIDNCASGGRRIDYEACKRSVPLWRSDYNCEVYPDLYEASQNHNFGLSYYLPYQSVGQGVTYNKYKDRSLTTTSVVFSIGTSKPDMLTEVPFDNLKKVWDDMKSYNYLMSCDYYPLTNFSLNDKVWMALQYDSPEKGEGCVICYRRANAPFNDAELALEAIDPQAKYEVTDLNTGNKTTLGGIQLKNLKIHLDKLESKVVKYKKIRF